VRTVVFVLSETRSGSTWLSYVLGSHRNVAHLGEYHRPFTFPGHVACRLCEAKGQPCPVFHGIEAIAADEAFDFAFDRLGVDVLVDCSKSLEWTARFLARGYAVKVVHLLRDPKGWYASERKREPMTPEQGLRRWNATNECIDRFVRERRLEHVRVLYEDLAADPLRGFPPLCAFLGFPFEPQSLRYWDKEHHGLGANGAAFNVLRAHPHAKLTTGDDAFYRERAGRVFRDERWKTLLAGDEIAFFEHARALERYFPDSGAPDRRAPPRGADTHEGRE